MTVPKTSPPPAVIALTQSALPVAESIATVFEGATVHVLAGRSKGSDAHEFDDPATHLRALFRTGTPVIGVCATGILVRLLAPVLSDKWSEPPILSVAEDGSAVVPLLGGHRGANRMARTLADALGCEAAITTASDATFGVALDDPPPGWRLANPEDAGAVTTALLDGATARIVGDAVPAWLEETDLPRVPDGAITLMVTAKRADGGPNTLVYHPAVLALGVGAERGASPAALQDLVQQTLAESGFAEAAIAAVVSLDAKADEPAVHALADTLSVPARFFPPERLEMETPNLTEPSETVFKAVGCHGVAEAAALAATWPDGTLVVPKKKGDQVTCAIARAPVPIDPAGFGRGRGTLAVIGTGPGTRDWRPPETAHWIDRATDLVGYSLYLDLLGPTRPGTARHDFPLGDEEVRARTALDLAAQGRTVALVSSGDPGIYAMAAVVFEVLDREANPDWRWADIVVCPGISAMQAAAARLGAPLGHDFCAISLSDLLTPWETIETRLGAAAEGDFVTALYNPVSKTRTEQLPRALDILRRHRAGETAVAIARNLGRTGESITVTTLDALDPGKVDMLSLILIGSSETRLIPRPGHRPWVYTPRGYGRKAG